jgi:hypothetical protein
MMLPSLGGGGGGFQWCYYGVTMVLLWCYCSVNLPPLCQVAPLVSFGIGRGTCQWTFSGVLHS